MKTVHEVSEITGVSVRALQYYDKIGLLRATERSTAGYRLYDDAALEKLQQILLFRALEFRLEEIKDILDNPAFDQRQALEDQITLLELRRQHIDSLISLARFIKVRGVNYLNFTAFDTQKLDEYAARAKERWRRTPEYAEFETKDQDRSEKEKSLLANEMMELFAELGSFRSSDPAGEEAQRLIKKLQDFITDHFYACTPAILYSLGSMYAGGGELTENIDRAGGPGTGEFAWRAIQAFCGKQASPQ